MDIKFARKYLKGHPKYGEDTFFVEKIWANNDALKGVYIKPLSTEILEAEYKNYLKKDFYPKGHTIRKGDRWKAGDKFDAAVWYDRPYASKQIIIGMDIPIVRTYKFDVLVYPSYALINLDGRPITRKTKEEDRIVWDGLRNLKTIALNDGLETQDFISWFQFPTEFHGQIIVWDPNIDYANELSFLN